MRIVVLLVLVGACDQGIKPKPAASAPAPVAPAAAVRVPHGRFTGGAWDVIAPVLTFHRAN